MRQKQVLVVEHHPWGASREGRLEDLAQTVARVPCDLVLSATPADLAPLIAAGKPVLRVHYEMNGGKELGPIVMGLLKRLGCLAAV